MGAGRICGLVLFCGCSPSSKSPVDLELAVVEVVRAVLLLSLSSIVSGDMDLVFLVWLLEFWKLDFRNEPGLLLS